MLYKKIYATILLGTLSYGSVQCMQSGITDQTWQDVQIAARDAVVQIFVTSRDTNWFHPYCMNNTKNGCGTGFLINKEGYIVTCSHVVENALSVFISIASFGQQRFKVDVIGICPERDIALLRLTQESLNVIGQEFNQIPYLQLGDSDDIRSGEEVLLLGYPLGAKELKATSGVVSAHLHRFLQHDIASNPGNSGGPVFNKKGMVVGVLSRGNKEAQGTNFAVPINVLKSSLSDLYDHKLLKINSDFGMVWESTNQEIRSYFGNTDVHGCLVCDLDPCKKAYAAGLRIGDIISAVNGYSIDNYCEIIILPGSSKISFYEYIAMLPLGAEVNFRVWRKGVALDISVTIDLLDDNNISTKYPSYEKIDYEVFAGMVIMPLTVNYIKACSKDKPGLARYLTNLHDNGPRLVIANLISGSNTEHIKTIRWADTINEVNGECVTTLDELRKALQKSLDTGYIVIKTTDETFLNTNDALTVLSLSDSCKETVELSHLHQYPLSQFVKELIRQVDDSLL
jgi:S1-C subfamily serine protease